MFNLMQTCCSGLGEIVQRLLLLATDIALIMYGLVASVQDRRHSCDESLHAYALLCLVLCSIDIVWEAYRCSTVAALDRLQNECGPMGGPLSGGGLLGVDPCDRSVMEDGLQPPRMREGIRSLADGIRVQTAMTQKKAANLQFWLVMFSTLVSLMFSLLASHDEDCAMQVPKLYLYVRVFSYVFIMRLGVMMLWTCCRTIKDYEDVVNKSSQESRNQARDLATF